MPGDTLLQCTECDTGFVWTTAEQSKGPPESRCPMCRLLAPAPGRSRGLVKWLNRSKGYGFVTPANGPDLFVHQSGLAPGQPLPRAGQLVEFSRLVTPRGAQAEQVVLLETPGNASPPAATSDSNAS